ncbi:MAG: hypothetical protein R3182_04935 [Draconibacterium sp.]|nr:hypothetical protein [Draconibacterium sp.]
MKKKVNKHNNPEFDKFDRKQKKHSGFKQKSSKQKFSIYDDFDDDELTVYFSEMEE